MEGQYVNTASMKALGDTPRINIPSEISLLEERLTTLDKMIAGVYDRFASVRCAEDRAMRGSDSEPRSASSPLCSAIRGCSDKVEYCARRLGELIESVDL